MVTIALSVTWLIGYAIGVVVVIIAAALLLAIIGLGRRIVTQAESITEALDGAREHTEPLFEVKHTNLAVDRVTRGLRAARGAEPDDDGPAPDSRETATPALAEGRPASPVDRLKGGLRRTLGADQ